MCVLFRSMTANLEPEEYSTITSSKTSQYSAPFPFELKLIRRDNP